ncbi:MAG: AAA family ATPase [Desulfovibrionales bacterium]|nr:MAG: AAA family ATPase [Desulfovibrionales bacterium]
MFTPAKRQQSKIRLGLIGPSGSGKTYSALLIAQGLGGKIALLDTERGSGSLYADLCAYDVAELTPPFDPARYVKAIQGAAEAGYDVLIIDSLTHAWAGEGGILEFVDRATQAVKNNFAAWREASPKHNALVDAMLGAPLHIIATIRSKTAWEVVKDERTGKTKPVKIGLAPIQRDGLEYEFTAVLELSVDGHIATATKDRTGLFDGSYFTPGKETGKKLIAWLNGEPVNGNGDDHPVDPKPARNVVQMPAPPKVEPRTERGTSVGDLFGVLRTLGLGGQVEFYEMYLAKKYGHGSKDLTPGEISEQFITLSRCKRDAKMLKQLTDYFAALENYKKAA